MKLKELVPGKLYKIMMIRPTHPDEAPIPVLIESDIMSDDLIDYRRLIGMFMMIGHVKIKNRDYTKVIDKGGLSFIYSNMYYCSPTNPEDAYYDFVEVI